jgi:hypothetical protein
MNRGGRGVRRVFFSSSVPEAWRILATGTMKKKRFCGLRVLRGFNDAGFVPSWDY